LEIISENPEGHYSPNTPIELFMESYCDIIDTLKKKGIFLGRLKINIKYDITISIVCRKKDLS
jgi:hypothetical protein